MEHESGATAMTRPSARFKGTVVKVIDDPLPERTPAEREALVSWVESWPSRPHESLGVPRWHVGDLLARVPANDNALLPLVTERTRARRARDAEQEIVLELFREQPSAERYSVEVARATGMPVSRTYGRLQALQSAGLLESRMLVSPKSGHGRRYYRLKSDS